MFMNILTYLYANNCLLLRVKYYVSFSCISTLSLYRVSSCINFHFFTILERFAVKPMCLMVGIMLSPSYIDFFLAFPLKMGIKGFIVIIIITIIHNYNY